jgi:hypothetical protein
MGAGIKIFRNDTTLKLTALAHRSTLQIILIEDVNGAREYIILDGSNPIFATATIEDIKRALTGLKMMEASATDKDTIN